MNRSQGLYGVRPVLCSSAFRGMRGGGWWVRAGVGLLLCVMCAPPANAQLTATGLSGGNDLEASAPAPENPAGSSVLAEGSKLSANEVPKGLAKSDWDSIRAAYEAGRHAFQPVAGGEGVWQARNPGQQWTTRFDGCGFLAKPREGDWSWGLALTRYGFAGAERILPGGPMVVADGMRLTYAWDGVLEEWFVNDTRGLEHGFTVRARPEGATPGAALAFDLRVLGTLTPRVAADGQGVRFHDGEGNSVVNYSGLKVWDADGQTLASRFFADGDGLRLLVDDEEARYPVTIDPIAQQAYLKASNTGASDDFGCSVSVSGDTVVVGANVEDSSTTGVNSTPNESAGSSGAAYVFVRSGGTWSQQAYLKASNTGASDFFGCSVSVSGDTVVVGAYYEDSSTTGVNSIPNESALDSGAAYVFFRSGGVWSQQAYLKASNTGAGDYFGCSVSVSGDTVVVGARGEDSSTTGVNSTPNESASSSGAAYVFARSGGVWSQQAYLKASNTGAGDIFGWSVSVSGDTVVVGAYQEASSTTGVNSTPNNFARYSGAAYVFVRSGGVWSQQAYLKASNTGVDDYFGSSVSVSGDTVVVGAYGEDSSTTGVNSTPNESASSSGAAYVFARSGGVWSQQAYLKASNTGAGDIFGWSVSVSGDTVVVGAYQEASSTTGVNSTPNESAGSSGAAYVFVRSGGTWSQQAYLKASNTGASDYFGCSVSVSGDTVVVGAYYEDSSTTGVNSTPDESGGDSGAAYVFSGFPYVDLVVEQPAGSALVDGTGSIGFGSQNSGTTGAPKVLTVRNTGNENLVIAGVAKSGTHAGDFSVDTSGMTLFLAPSAATTFSVTFTAGAAGARTAALEVTSNDPDESPFDITLTGEGVAPPVASFIANPNPAACGQAVAFDAAASTAHPGRAITSYAWDFGDGAVATGSAPSHAYSAFGSYMATLTVTDNSTPPQIDTETLSVVVNQGNQAPVAHAGGPYLADLGSVLTLDGSGSSDPDAACGDSIVNYDWDLDGDMVFDDLTGVAPGMTAAQVNNLGLGSHPVSLRVTDSFGLTHSATTTLTVYSNVPTARLTANPNPAGCGEAVSFDGTASSHDRPDRAITGYSWDFGDGSPLASGATPTHSYSAFGTYNVILTVTDNNVPPKTDTETLSVVVDQGNQAPVAHAGGPYDADLGSGLALDGSASSDPDIGCGDSIVAYEWDLDNDGVFNDLTGVAPGVTAAQVNALGLGSHPVSLRVTDEFGLTHDASTTLTVYNNVPTARLTASPNPAGCGAPVSFDGTASSHDRPDRAITGYSWDFGDGSPLASGATPTHSYSAFGTYTVTLTVTDNNVPPKTDTETLSVVVNQGNQAPVAHAGGPYLADLGSVLTLDGSGSSDPDAGCGDSIVAYEWDLDNDGVFDDLTGVAPGVTAAQVDNLGLGSHPVSLRVTDEFGLTHDASTTLTVYNNVPTARLTASPNPAGCGAPVSFDGTASSHDRPDRTITGYSWDFGDGTPLASGPTPIHSFGRCDAFPVTLTVTDSAGGSASTTETVTVEDRTPPAVVWPPDQSVVAGMSIEPSAMGVPIATDECGTPEVSYEDATTANPECPAGLILHRTWTVSDGYNNVQHVQTITVGTGDGGPAQILQHPQSQTVALGQPVTFSVSVVAECGATFQWMRNGVLIPGAIGPSYTRPAALALDNGAQFACRVRTGVIVQSLSAMLLVTGTIPVPMPPDQPPLQIELDPSDPGTVVFRFPTEVGFLYRLQAKVTGGVEWLNLSLEISGGGVPVEIRIPAADLPSGVFRAMVTPLVTP